MMKRKIRIGLKGKVALLLALLLASVLIVLSTLVLAGIREDQRSRLEQSFAHEAATANLRVRQEFLTGTRVTPALFMQQSGQRLAVDLGAQSGMAITLYQADGSFVGTSLPVQPKTDVKDALAYTARGQSAYITEGDQILYLAPLYQADERLGTIQFHASLAEQNAFYLRIQNLFIVAGVAVLGVGFFIGYIYVWRQVNVIARLNLAAKQIGEGNYLDTLPVRRRDELGELAEGIYEMSGSISSSVSQLTEERLKLLDAIARLQELEQQQKQFIGNISHELKTPLTSIMAYADLLEMYRDDPSLLEEARIQIGREAERLYELIEKALQLSSMDIYDFETKVDHVQMLPLLQEAADRMQAKAGRNQVAIETHVTDGTAWVDPENVMHMVLNLLDNAIKYNKPGGTVTLSNHSVKNATGGDHMVIEVLDTGIGIPVDVQSRIFDPFYTVSGDRSRAHGGTGLGLPLVRSLAEKQHGSVRLVNSSIHGSKFEITVPMNPPVTEQHLKESSDAH